MSEHTATSSGNGGARLAAHERMSTGALARWARACATHPWRVLGSWLGIIVVLIGLVATIGGGLRDEFEIPGSDTQRATDLIESEFASEQGGVLNIVFAAPEGERLDTPERKAAIEQAMAKLRAAPFVAAKGAEPVDGESKLSSVGDPFSADTFSKSGRIAYAEAQFDQTIEDKDRDAVVAVEDAVRAAVEPVGVTVEYNGEAEFPPIEQGIVRAPRPPRRADRAAHRLPHVRRCVHPDHARDRGAGDRVPPPLHPRRVDRHQHRHADPRVDDRARRRDRLLAVHRHALPAVPPRGAGAARRGRRGRCLGGARGAVRRADGRDLGDRARVLRPRLRDEARDRERARRPDDGAACELLPARRPCAARPQGRPAQGAVPACHRRLGSRTRQDAVRALGPVRDAERADHLPGPARRGHRPRGHLRARPARRRRPGHAAQGADEPSRVRPARGGLRARVQRPDPDRGRHAGRPGRRRSASTRTCRA